MKTNALLTSLGMVGVMALSYFYFQGQSRFAAHHQKMLALISAANETDAALDANLLKSRDFLLLNYDPIVRNEEEMRAICAELRSAELRATALGASDLAKKADEYCAAVELSIQDVELFKSKNSILRNSLFYVQGLAGESRREKKLARLQALLDATISFYLLPNEEDRAQITRLLAVPSNAESEMTYRHVRTILAEKTEVNELVKKIMDSPAQNRLDELSAEYDRYYEMSENSAATFRTLLFWSSIALLIGVLYGVTRIFKAARSLSEANEQLENRVHERTRELSESQALILQQQQTLLATTKMSALGEMAAGMAHEINNPLAIIQLNATQLAELMGQTPIREKLAAQMLQSIVQTTERIAKIVQGLRTFSRDGSQDAFARVSVVKLIGETAAFCRERFRTHGVELILEEVDPAISFEGRATQISQVLLNLLTNAFDAVGGRSAKWVKISAKLNGDRVEIRVFDSGEGISPEINRKIFQPFFTTKEIGKGTGMGLSISLGIVQAHRGRLFIDEAAGNTCFVIELPRLQAPPVV